MALQLIFDCDKGETICKHTEQSEVHDGIKFQIVDAASVLVF